MALRNVRVVGVIALLALAAGAVSVWAGSLQIGVSAEPLDIAGGGFFLDASTDLILAEGKVATFVVRPALTLGPLPLNASVWGVDLFAVLAVPLDGVTLFAGVGPGFLFWFSPATVSWSVVSTFGMSGIRILDTLEVYVQCKLRGAGFFVSPGFGVELEW